VAVHAVFVIVVLAVVKVTVIVTLITIRRSHQTRLVMANLAVVKVAVMTRQQHLHEQLGDEYDDASNVTRDVVMNAIDSILTHAWLASLISILFSLLLFSISTAFDCF